MKKQLLLAAAFALALPIFFARASAAQDFPPQFSSTWKKEELQKLLDGQIVIRNIKKCKNISIQSGLNPCADKVVALAKSVNANYLAEIVYKMPKAGNENIVAQAVSVFEDINLYKEIIYTDEKKGKSRPLFPLVEGRFRNDAPGWIQIGSHIRMDMLSAYDSELQIEWGADGFYFQQQNATPLYWKSFKAVKEGDMIAGVCCFEWNGDWYVYALGGVRAPRIPFVIAEIERQFIGRIKDFTVFYIRKFNIKQF